MRQPSRRPQQRSELAEALAACRGAFISIGLMAGMSNILLLTGAFFMLEIYDRVLPSRSIPTLFGAIILGIITMMTETMTRDPTRAATTFAMARQSLAEASRRNAEVLTAMGMTGRIAALWSDANTKYLASQRRASDVAGGFGSASKVLRMMLQSGVLAVGAYLVIYQQATAGIIIAGSILSARALAPVDLAIANWRGFVGARQG